jgi:hypothetical protein
MELEFRVLGPFEVNRAGHPVHIDGAKQRLLLAFLLLRANQAVAPADMIAEIWPGGAPRSAPGEPADLSGRPTPRAAGGRPPGRATRRALPQPPRLRAGRAPGEG